MNFSVTLSHLGADFLFLGRIPEGGPLSRGPRASMVQIILEQNKGVVSEV